MRRIVVLLLALTVLLSFVGCKGKASRSDMDDLKKAKVGSYVFIGEYEQDNDESTGKEAIEWLVLDKQEDKMLVISRYGLDCQPYNTEDVDVTWETCSLRKWLNSTFYEAAFIPEEKNVILTSTVTADTNPEYDTPAGNDTTDRVFLLSMVEANRYFADDDARKCQGSPYCHAQGAVKADNGNSWWWLRSPGDEPDRAGDVFYNGSIIDYGTSATLNRGAVRPAMWIYLKP
jgi:hypothetical protein